MINNITNAIDADAKTIRKILDTQKYDIGVFQREYKWERKQVEQLLSDLESKFFSAYNEEHKRTDVQKYPPYYLGSIIISCKDGKQSIIDGQQRLTSITLLLIYLQNLQKKSKAKVAIKNLIFSEQFGNKSYNLVIADRIECMDALYTNKDFRPCGGESVQNIYQRYDDIEEIFPEDLKEKALPYFIDWLIEKVICVKIKTGSDEDAYTIFETMNDRGLNLTATEMLKGYLLSNLDSDEYKKELNDIWKNRIANLRDKNEEEDMEFFKAWFRAKYADSIRLRKKGAENEDFEKIGSRFHSWVRDNKNIIGLNETNDFYHFIKIQFGFFLDLYLQITKAANEMDKNLEHVFYIKTRGFPTSFYSPLIMSPIKVKDDKKTIEKKIALVSRFLETFIVYRAVNYKTLGYSSIRYVMFSLIKEIRNKDVLELADILKSKLKESEHNLCGLKNFRLHYQNKRMVQFLLARITNHIEKKCGIQKNFVDYVARNMKKPFEIEHIWADKFEEHKNEFTQESEFDNFRNMFGALVLIPQGFNQSFGDKSYEEKLTGYFGQNLLAQTLSNQCYENNPSFIRYKKESKLPFTPHKNFTKADLLQRQNLYQKICEEIWDTNGFDEIINR